MIPIIKNTEQNDFVCLAKVWPKSGQSAMMDDLRRYLLCTLCILYDVLCVYSFAAWCRTYPTLYVLLT